MTSVFAPDTLEHALNSALRDEVLRCWHTNKVFYFNPETWEKQDNRAEIARLLGTTVEYIDAVGVEIMREREAGFAKIDAAAWSVDAKRWGDGASAAS